MNDEALSLDPARCALDRPVENVNVVKVTVPGAKVEIEAVAVIPS